VNERQFLTQSKDRPVLTQKRPEPVDLLAPPAPDYNSIPNDLFAPLMSSLPRSISLSVNPFETEEKIPEPKYEPVQTTTNNAQSDLFNIDMLYLGDGYSPIVAKRAEEAAKPKMYVPNTVPNMPINQIQTERMSIPQYQMQGPMNYMQGPMNSMQGQMNQMQGQMNPMMMAYMTNMMNPWGRPAQNNM